MTFYIYLFENQTDVYGLYLFTDLSLHTLNCKLLTELSLHTLNYKLLTELSLYTFNCKLLTKLLTVN